MPQSKPGLLAAPFSANGIMCYKMLHHIQKQPNDSTELMIGRLDCPQVVASQYIFQQSFLYLVVWMLKQVTVNGCMSSIDGHSSW